MRKISKIIIVITLLFSVVSCSNWIDTDINVDPNSPADVPLSYILPSIQANVGYNLGGNDVVRTTNNWMQYMDGIARQSHAEATYIYSGADCNNLWNTAYATILSDSKILIDKATEQNAYHFKGVGQVLTALTLGYLTDLWGDIPYSDALNPEVLMPKFDSQQDIYKAMNTLLDSAIANLSNTNNKIALKGDMMYANNAANWIKAAYSLKARYALQLSAVNGAAAYTAALANLDKAFTSNAQNFGFKFGVNDSEKSPLRQFMDQRGDMAMSSTFINFLKTNTDPRLSFYAAATAGGEYFGSVPGSQAEPSAVSAPGAYVAASDAKVYFMTYAELKFIEAEAKFNTGDKAGALAAFQAGVAESVNNVTGSANQAWLDANINNVTEATLTLEMIITQKYVANFGQLQPFSDYRRTGFPTILVAVTGASSTTPPTRYPYSQEEVTYNDNTPAATMFDKVWWDK